MKKYSPLIFIAILIASIIAIWLLPTDWIDQCDRKCTTHCQKRCFARHYCPVAEDR